jgi:hypothetical protein
MNAPAEIPTIRREDYEPTIRALMPSSEGEDMEIRCSLLLMRDCAASEKRFCCEDSWPLMDHVERLASGYAFHHMPLDRFRDIRDALRKTVAAAASFESVHQQMAREGGGASE